jgi:hypothetical protein
MQSPISEILKRLANNMPGSDFSSNLNPNMQGMFQKTPAAGSRSGLGQSMDAGDPTGGFDQWNAETYGGAGRGGQTGGFGNPFFIPSGQGGGQSPIGGAISNNPMYTTQNPRMAGTTSGTAPGYSTTPGTGAPTPISGQDPNYFSQITAPGINTQLAYNLNQQGIAAAIQRMQGAGLPTDANSIKTMAAAIAGLQSEPIRRAKQEGLQSIENMTQGSGSALGTNRDRMISSLLGSEAGAQRQSTTQTNIDLIGKLMSMYAGMR